MMIEYNLRKGDALVVQGVGVGILTRQTKAYWYYFFSGKECRVSKQRLWTLIDLEPYVSVTYGTTMKRRRKYKKGRALDLHGVKHDDVREVVCKFLNFIELPCTIVTGNSEKMKNAVFSIAESYGFSCREESAQNPGALIITEDSGV
tara:strand:+ start:100 stop:540 length:441 start_codon:yes stop_codon:yes gene_type:complete